MRLPWNRKYMEIGFHVILTVLLLVGMIAPVSYTHLDVYKRQR